jgi:hypothetical protein
MKKLFTVDDLEEVVKMLLEARGLAIGLQECAWKMEEHICSLYQDIEEERGKIDRALNKLCVELPPDGRYTDDIPF